MQRHQDEDVDTPSLMLLVYTLLYEQIRCLDFTMVAFVCKSSTIGWTVAACRGVLNCDVYFWSDSAALPIVGHQNCYTNL